MALGKLTETFLKRHIEELGRDYKSFAILTEDKKFKEAVVEAIYHAELVVCLYVNSQADDLFGLPITEFCLNNVPSIEDSLCDLVKMSLDFDNVVEEATGIKSIMRYIKCELGWSYEE